MSARNTSDPSVDARRDLQRSRFGAYFSRVFAFALCTTNDEQAARDATVSAFAESFTLPELREDEYEVALFRIARGHLPGRARKQLRHTDGLTTREREVVSLIFDAQLDHGQVARIMGVRDETLVAILLRGLHKLRFDSSEPGAGSTVSAYS